MHHLPQGYPGLLMSLNTEEKKTKNGEIKKKTLALMERNLKQSRLILGGPSADGR